MTASPPLAPRLVDHVVMPMASLDAARTVLRALGFLAAPYAQHPFGTENACVFFSDGTFLEPLAVAERETCERAARQGNVFVAHDQAFRFRRGVPGFSAIAFRSKDAAGDHDAFCVSGIAGGAPLEFSRALLTRDGASRVLTFRLAFAGDRRAPDVSLFTCQALSAPGDRSNLTTHPNGVTGLSRIVLSEPNPTDFQYLLQDVARRRDLLADSFGLSIDTGNVVLDVLTPEGLAARYGRARDAARGLLIEGVVLAVPDLGPVRDMAAAGGLDAETVAGRLVVGLGRYGFLAFEASS